MKLLTLLIVLMLSVSVLLIGCDQPMMQPITEIVTPPDTEIVTPPDTRDCYTYTEFFRESASGNGKSQ